MKTSPSSPESPQIQHLTTNTGYVQAFALTAQNFKPEMHKALGYESPASMRNGAVSSVWHGIKRTHGVAQDTKAPVLVENLRAMVRNLRPGLIGIRDRALLLVGFAGAFRGSELVALDAEDVQFTSDGLAATQRRWIPGGGGLPTSKPAPGPKRSGRRLGRWGLHTRAQVWNVAFV